MSAVLCILTSGETRNPIGSIASLNMYVAIGFGSAMILVDGTPLLDGEPRSLYRRVCISACPACAGRSEFDCEVAGHVERPTFEWRRRLRDRLNERSFRVARDRFLTLARVERYLVHRERSGDPVTGRITCSIHGPLWSAEWFREVPNRWVCIETGEGFA